MADQIMALCDETEYEHEDFATSLYETTSSIAENIHRCRRVTEKQQQALDNMLESAEGLYE